jgi:nitroreductase
MTMTVAQATLARQSIRAFRPDPVAQADVEALLDLARHAPSGGNLQPWVVYAIAGAAKDALIAAVAQKLAHNERETPPYDVYPKNLWEPLRSRRREAGLQRFAALGMPRDGGAEAILERRNLEFFGAPVGLFFCLDRRVGPPQWSDMGMFMQTLMLLATARGLATCPQEIWSGWPDSVRAALDLPAHLMTFSGMALGYPDPESPMNTYRTARDEVATFTTFVGFPP